MSGDIGVRAVVLYVLSPASVSIDELPWKVCCELEKAPIEGRQIGFPVYRGQSARPRFKTVKGTFDPYAIQTNLNRPLSTSAMLNAHVVSFAAPRGRVFKINLTPGVDYVNVVRVAEEARSKIDNDEYFKDILDSLPDTNTYKKGSEKYPPATPESLRARFWELVKQENEIILNPKTVFFRSEQNPVETWNRQNSQEDNAVSVVTIPDDPKMGEKDIEVYVTGVWSKPPKYDKAINEETKTPEGGHRSYRGRTFRTKTLRRNKYGRRLTRQSKHRVRNRHA